MQGVKPWVVALVIAAFIGFCALGYFYFPYSESMQGYKKTGLIVNSDGSTSTFYIPETED